MISLPPSGFEPAVPARERPQTYALDSPPLGTATRPHAPKKFCLPQYCCEKVRPQYRLSLFSQKLYLIELQGKTFLRVISEDPESAVQHHDVQFIDKVGCDYHAGSEALHLLLQLDMSPEPTNML